VTDITAKLDPSERPDRSHLYDDIKLSLDFDASEDEQSVMAGIILKPDVAKNWEIHLTAKELDAFRGLEVGIQLQISLSTDPFEALWRIIGG
jgi:hypothetical protein